MDGDAVWAAGGAVFGVGVFAAVALVLMLALCLWTVRIIWELAFG